MVISLQQREGGGGGGKGERLPNNGSCCSWVYGLFSNLLHYYAEIVCVCMCGVCVCVCVCGVYVPVLKRSPGTLGSLELLC